MPRRTSRLLTADGPAGATLEDWKKLWKDGFVPEEVLTYNEAALIDAFRSGRYVFSPQTAYDLQQLNDPQKSAQVAGKISFLPYQGQSWGIVDGAMYLMTSRKRPAAADRRRQALHQLVRLQGPERQDLRRRTLAARSRCCSRPTRKLMESPETAEHHPQAARPPGGLREADGHLQSAPYPKGAWNVVWAEEFNGWLKDKLLAFLQNDLKSADVDQGYQRQDRPAQPQVQDQRRSAGMPGSVPPFADADRRGPASGAIRLPVRRSWSRCRSWRSCCWSSPIRSATRSG